MQCAHECVVCVLCREGSTVFRGTRVVLAAMCLTSYNHYLTSFLKPLLPPYTFYRHHTSLKKVTISESLHIACKTNCAVNSHRMRGTYLCEKDGA